MTNSKIEQKKKTVSLRSIVFEKDLTPVWKNYIWVSITVVSEQNIKIKTYTSLSN